MWFRSLKAETNHWACHHVLRRCNSSQKQTQTVTASGSTEAEFVAAFTAAKTAQCLKFVLQELGFSQEGPTKIHIDNQVALQIVNEDQASTIQNMHLDIGFFSLQDWREEGSVSMIHIARVPTPSDDLTAPSACCLHAMHCQRMTGHFN